MTTNTQTTNRTGTAANYHYDDLPRLMTLMTGEEKHSFSATSTLDVLWTLYDRVLRFDPSQPDDPRRDRFLLSKGHGPMAYYAVLAAKGFLDEETLRTWARYDSILGMHPDSSLVPGVEIASGSLGHGLGIGVGMTAGLRLKRMPEPRVFCLLGDAEFDEGSNYEALSIAARMGLDNLTAIVVDNQSASHGWPGGIAERFATEGWSTATVDGRNHDAIEAAINAPHPDRPYAVVATVESKG